ncbi:MAG: ferrous iron transport protein B [Armatimonadota bacterium]
MKCHVSAARPAGQTARHVVLVGNPNVGKSVIFSALTGTYVTVSNYPGTTVEITSGNAVIGGRRVTVADTPGVNNLIPASEDEQVTRDILLNEDVDAVLQVADAKNLRRALFLSVQLAEMGVPFVIALNMMDEASNRGIQADPEKLSRILGVPVVATVATHAKGIDAVRQALLTPARANLHVPYQPEIEEAATAVAALLPKAPVSRRSIALMLLAGDETLLGWLGDRTSPDVIAEIRRIRNQLAGRLPEPIGYLISKSRLQLAESIAGKVATEVESAAGHTGLAGRLAMHPVWGIPILLAVLYMVYLFVGVLGAQTAVGFLEETVFGTYLNPLAMRSVKQLVPIACIQDLLVGQYGLITMALTYALAIVLPIVGSFFLAFGVLEDSGYLPRLAVMVNRIFRSFGLNGKAVLPMVLGLGCDTMATLTVRILETRKERILATFLLTLAIPCSAQLGVILGMLGALSGTATVIWLSMIALSLLIVGRTAAKLLPGDASDFVLELPPIRIPQIRNLAVKVAARMEWYVKEAVPLFVLGTLILFVSDRTGILSLVEQAFRPVVVSLLGLPPQAAASFIMGFLRRDYGATMLYTMAQHGQLTHSQVLVSVVVITFFLPCVAQFFVTAKERGLRAAVAIAFSVMVYAVAAGTLLNLALKTLGIRL